MISSEEIKKNLNTNIIGSEIVYYPSVDSTNNIAKKMAEEGCQEGVIVIADHQTKGRGRRGKSWNSPYGKGIWASIVLRPLIPPVRSAAFTLTAAVSVCRALRQSTGLKINIKWPNDLRINYKKIGGILTELNAETYRLNHVVIGIGINIENEIFPDELGNIATSLRLESDGESRFNKVGILTSILNEFENDYKRFLAGGLEDILEEWRRYSDTLGEQVQVIDYKGSYTGKALDIDSDGALLIEKKDGTLTKVTSGEVSLRV